MRLRPRPLAPSPPPAVRIDYRPALHKPGAAAVVAATCGVNLVISRMTADRQHQDALELPSPRQCQVREISTCAPCMQAPKWRSSQQTVWPSTVRFFYAIVIQRAFSDTIPESACAPGYV